MHRGLVLSLVVFSALPLRARADDPVSAQERQRRGRASAEREPAAPASDGQAAPSPEEAARSSSTSGGSAEPSGPRLPMRDITVAEAAFSAVLSASILTAAIVPTPAAMPQWRGGILFDDEARRGLRLGSPADRRLAASISDGLLIGAAALPLLDAVILGWLVRGDPELMGRMLLIDLQALAFAQGLQALFKHATGRERPMARACREDAAARAGDPSCASEPDGNIAPESFFSGHTSAAFTSAALVCLHHTELGLVGPEGDAARCATGLAIASTVGLLRVLADRHYVTDVLVGASVGILSGWLVPWLLHYDVADAVGVEGASATLAPMIDGQTIGAQVFGSF